MKLDHIFLNVNKVLYAIESWSWDIFPARPGSASWQRSLPLQFSVSKHSPPSLFQSFLSCQLQILLLTLFQSPMCSPLHLKGWPPPPPPHLPSSYCPRTSSVLTQPYTDSSVHCRGKKICSPKESSLGLIGFGGFFAVHTIHFLPIQWPMRSDKHLCPYQRRDRSKEERRPSPCDGTQLLNQPSWARVQGSKEIPSPSARNTTADWSRTTDSQDGSCDVRTSAQIARIWKIPRGLSNRPRRKELLLFEKKWALLNQVPLKLKTRDEKEHELTAPAKCPGLPASSTTQPLRGSLWRFPSSRGMGISCLAFGRGGMEECKQEKSILELLHANLLTYNNVSDPRGFLCWKYNEI